MNYLYLIGALVFNIVANISMKLAALRGLDLSVHSPLVLLQRNWPAVASISLYGVSAVFYFLSLRSLPLIVVYPTIIFLGFLAIHIFSVFVLGERVVFWQIIGYVFVLAGIALILFFSHKK